MIPRTVAVSLLATLLCFPAGASQPEGLAGRLTANLEANDLLCGVRSFELYQSFEPRQLEPSDTLMLEMAIIPFASGTTSVGLDELGGPTFLDILFSEGLVNGLPYRRAGWNDITVQVRAATQDYVMTVNGVRGGPFALGSFCQDQGGCFSVQALRLHGFSNGDGALAFIDSISLSRESAAGQELLYELPFNPCFQLPQVVGGLTFTRPPDRVGPRGCRDRFREQLE